jgi:hypothetical protein
VARLSTTKYCGYCRNYWPEDDHVKVKKGKPGHQVTVTQCGPCFLARQNKAANTKRFESILDRTKAENKRAYGHFDKESR